MVDPNEDIVISGIGGIFPQCKNVGEFKKKLFGNEKIEFEEKWSKDYGTCSTFGGISVDRFDNSYFGIHRSQTVYMDPIHRLCLERTFEAIIDAGINPNTLRGKKIGCYVGMTMDENNSLFLESVVSGYGVTGHARAMLPNRISYWLNLKGPSVAYDCNWATGIQIIYLAYEAIKRGECDAAVVGAANLIFFPEFHQMYDEIGIVSPDGNTKAFDANANGYGRSEGVVMLYIQKASKAKRSYGTIVHVGAQCDGFTDEQFLHISTSSMTDFLEEFYRDSPIKPQDIDYVETYGCGVKEIDKSELDALEEVFCKNRSNSLLIGTVKNQFGHSESCSALFSLVKVLLAFEEETIPATLNIENFNPDIRGLWNGKFEVVQANRKWISDYVAVHGIGIHQYFGHIVIKRNPKKKDILKNDIPRILPVSTRTEDSVKEALRTLKEQPDDPEYNRLVQEVFSKHIPLHMYRGYLVQGQEVKEEFAHQGSNKRSVWFVYSGMGSQWLGMLSDLMKFPVAAQSITNLHNILKSRGLDLINILSSKDETVFDNVLHCFVGIAAMQIALTDLLNALGIVPDGIIGHSLGELGCAYADGCMTAEQTIIAAYSRGKASLEATLIKGMMAAIGMGNDQIKDQLPPTIEVACHNSSESCTISGPREDMEVFVKEIQDKGIFARLVNVANIAYHSRYIKPAAPLLHKYLEDVLPEPVLRSRKWISTSNKVENWNTDLAKYSSADYHTNNLLSSVLFEEGCKHIPKDAILIEIAPHGLLQAILKRSMKECTNIPLTNRSAKSGVEFFLQSLGKLYLSGVDVNFAKLYPPVSFPVSRNTATLSNLAGWNYTDRWELSNAEDQRSANKVIKHFRINLNSKKYEYLLGHEIGQVVLPVGVYLAYVCQYLESDCVVFENLYFRKHLALSKLNETDLHLTLQNCSGEFEIWTNNEQLLSGKVTMPEDDTFLQHRENVDLNGNNVELRETEVYDELKCRGYNYTGSYRAVRSLTITKEGSVGRIECGDEWSTLIDGMIQQHALTSGEKYQKILLPKTINQVWIDTKKLRGNNKTFEVSYNYDIQILGTDGVKIKNIDLASWSIEESELVLESVECIPLEKITFKNTEAALEFAVQLTRSNFRKPEMATILVTDLESTNYLFFDDLKKISNALCHLNVDVTRATSVDEIYVQQVYPQLVVSEVDPNEDLLKKVSSSDIFLFAKTSEFVLKYPGIVEVAKIIVNTEEYSIFRRIITADVVVVNIGAEIPNVEALDGENTWFSKLTDIVKAPRNSKKRLYLVSSLMPAEGFEYFIREIRQRPHMQNVRFLFNLDQMEDDIVQVFEKNLTVSILKRGKLHTIIHRSVQYKRDEICSVPPDATDRCKLFQYLSLNLSDETVEPSVRNNKVGNIDYSGIDANGKRVLGLAHIDKDSLQIKADPIFVWEVPKKWSLCAAVTVPHAYLSAYYMLIMKADLRKGDTVLIHAATSPIGLAAIMIGLTNHCNIFATVFNLQQKAYLMKHFCLKNKHKIIVLDGTSFKAVFMQATKGDGANVILNCLSGEYLRDSFDCCGHGGRFVHYGKHDLENGNSIGMSRFMLNVSFYIVDLNKMVALERDVKQQLWELFQTYLKREKIKAITWESGSYEDVPEIIRNLRNGTTIGKVILNVGDKSRNNLASIFTGNNFVCSDKSSYIVFGGSSKTWMNVVEWLVHRGAKKLIVSPYSKTDQTNLYRRLSLFRKYFNVDIVVSKHPVTSEVGVSQLLRESSSSGPIDAVFIVPNESETVTIEERAAIELLVKKLRLVAPTALLVNYLPTAAGICHDTDKGLRSYSIELIEDGDIRHGLKALNQVLPKGSGHTITFRKMKRRQNIIGIGRILPRLNEIVDSQKHSPLQPDVVQILTEGPTYIRELAPIFIIQGMTGKNEVKKLAKSLLYPTYCTVTPREPWSIEKLAKIYAEKILTIYPKNVYNLVSVSTSGALTLEIVRNLQQRRKHIDVHLFFIDSAPSLVQEAIVQLGETTDYEINVLRAILDIHDVEVLEELQSLNDWEERVKYCMKCSNHDDEIELQKGLMTLRNMLDASKCYTPQDLEITGQVHLLRPSIMDELDDCRLKEICHQPPQIKLIEGDHLSLICHPSTIKYINFHVDS